ncbi:hypothetical protein B0H19DRAFT_1147526 [Mycena capillaripes]|nr:hypothetical protein B0H19DRAFT_1147526 [Mycena capillaripes]
MAAHLRRRLVELDEQISEQKRVLRRLERNRIAVERELRATAVYPVLTLPTEIVAEIFGHCLPQVDLHDRAEDAPTSTLLLLVRVCRAWRDIAYATPLLWSTLHLRFHDMPHWISSEPGLVEAFIDRWFGLAGLCPLSLLLHASRGDGAVEPFTTSRMNDVIRRYSHRLRYLELDMSEIEIRHLGLGYMEFPLLRIVTFGYDHYPSSIPEPPLQVFENAPLLNDFRWGTSLGVIFSNFIPPWSQLTKYEGRIWDLRIFTLAPNLAEVACTLVALNPWVDDMTTNSKLRCLTITSSASYDILKHLTLPALQSLDISNLELDSNSLEAFLMRSLPPLHSLSLRADESCFAGWHRWVAHVGGTLEILRLKCPSAVIMSTIFDPKATKNLYSLPNIHTLRFDYAPGDLDYAQLVRFLYSRSDTLRSFRLIWNVRFPGNFSSTDDGLSWCGTIAEDLSRMISRGMDIYLGTKNKNYAAVEEY